MKYGVVYENGGKNVKCGLFEDKESALSFAAQQKMAGSGYVKLMVPAEGELVVTAKLVAPGDEKKSRRKPARGGKIDAAMKAATGRKKSSKRGAKRTPEELDKLRTRILSFVETNPDASAEAISSGLSMDAKELVLPIRKLVAEKQLAKKGKARATTYHVAS